MKAHLPHRAVIRLSGPDADNLLQGIITQDIGLLKNQPILFSAMLTAQGKFAHDFFIHADGDARLIEIDKSHLDAFVKKLKMYKLRADVTIENTELNVFTAWDEKSDGCAWKADPRMQALGWRAMLERSANEDEHHADAYDAHRLSLGVPEGVLDATDRHFALELGYDQLNGVSFIKGCFVGQEPTARMHYRKVLRKGLFMVSADGELPPPETPITAGELTLGEMRSSRGAQGLAFCRMDPVKSAQSKGLQIMAGEIPIQLSVPDYMHSKWDKIAQQNSS